MGSAHRSYSSALVTRALMMSPGVRSVAPLRNTEPSISGASHCERPMAPSASTSSTMTSMRAADLGGHQVAADLLLGGHEAVPALVLHLVGHDGRRGRWRGRRSTGSYLKQPTRSSSASSSQSSRIWKSASVSPGKPTMKVERMARSGQMSRQRAIALERLLLVRGAAHGLQHGGRGVLEGDVEVGQDLALGHQRHHARRRAGRGRRSAGAPRRRACRAPAARSRKWARERRALPGAGRRT